MEYTPVRINKDLYNKLAKLAEFEKRSVIKQLEVILEDALVPPAQTYHNADSTQFRKVG